MMNYSTGMLALVEKGKPCCAIILAASASPFECKAAEEFKHYVCLMTNTELPIIANVCPDGLKPIYIGEAADSALDKLLSKSNNPSAFALIVKSCGISIRGISAEGTLFGVYELLEQIGVRWYMPGTLGQVIPTLKSVYVKVQQNIQIPDMEYRMFQWIGSGNWPLHVRLGGKVRSIGTHGIPPFKGNMKCFFANTPEMFSLINGKRVPKQLCISNPKVFDLVLKAVREKLKQDNIVPSEDYYLGMGPEDGNGWCECIKCRQLDAGTVDILSGDISMTERYVWFFNKLLENLNDEYPRLHISWFVYGQHFFPPKTITPHSRLVAVFAPISLDRVRGMDNPMSPDRHILRYVIEGWKQCGCKEMYYRGYYNNLACPQFPISQIDRIRYEIPVLKEYGINVMFVENICQSWASSPLTLYLAAKMMWNTKTDIDATLEEFYKLFYGPAASAMKLYHEAVEAAFRDTPYFTGGSYPYFQIYTPKRRVEVRNYLDKAQNMIHGTENLYLQRVMINRQAFERLELFLDLINARNRCDFSEAWRKMQEYYTLNDSMVNHILEEDSGINGQRLVSYHELSTNPKSYFNLFFAPTIYAGYVRTVKDGKLITVLPDEWDFLIDPTNLGEAAGYQRPEKIGGNWQKLKTFSASWSDQGLHYYKGTAWYRTSFVIPEKFYSRKIYLWFSGVDEEAKVWINGQLLGTSLAPSGGLPGVPGGFHPFDMNASGIIQFGKENTIVVKIINKNLDELGTGGILGPVMLWSPDDNNWKSHEVVEF